MSKLSRFLLRLTVSTVLFAAFFVVTQDFQIFPGLYGSFRAPFLNAAPDEVDILRTPSEDGHEVLIWRVRGNVTPPIGAALLFHGNGEHLSSFFSTQKWLRSLGVTSYAVEYRGYNGWGSGWPSEERLYQDGIAAYRLMQTEEALPAEKMLVLGSSIGTGIAAHVASRTEAKMLILLSPYSSLSQVVKEMPLYGSLAPFLWYQLPTEEYVSQLQGRHIMIAHGMQDTVIPFHHSVQIKARVANSNTLTFIERADLHHNGLLQSLHAEIGKVIVQQFSGEGVKP